MKWEEGNGRRGGGGEQGNNGRRKGKIVMVSEDKKLSVVTIVLHDAGKRGLLASKANSL